MKGYFYEDGYLRTSSREYNLHSTNKFIHLTNDAVQKFSPDFGKCETANKLSYGDLQKYFDQEFPSLNICFYRDILP